MRRTHNRNSSISCLSLKDSLEITDYVTAGDILQFVMPYTSNSQIELLTKLTTSTPFEYIIYDKKFIILEVIYTVIHDCIFVKFIK